MLGRLIERLRSWWAVEAPEERIESGDGPYLDPAYNGQYTAERRLRKLSEAAEKQAENEEHDT